MTADKMLSGPIQHLTDLWINRYWTDVHWRISRYWTDVHHRNGVVITGQSGVIKPAEAQILAHVDNTPFGYQQFEATYPFDAHLRFLIEAIRRRRLAWHF